MSMMRVGYFYIPSSHGVNGRPMILDWLADEEVGFAAIQNIHLKVAYVREASNSGYQLHPVYLNTRAHAAISETDIILPDGWNAVSVYTQTHGNMLMIIEKVTNTVNNQDFSQDPAPHEHILFDSVIHNTLAAPVDAVSYALSPVDSFALDSTPIFGNSDIDIFSVVESNWMNPVPISPAVSSVALTLPPYDLPIAHVHPSLLPHGSIIGFQSPPAFVGCNPEVFHQGISYTADYLKAHFPAAWSIISDARISVKNRLHLHYDSEAAFKSQCVQAITEMQTFATPSQPAELGLRCRETGNIIHLDIQHGHIVDMLYLERSTFAKAMKTCVQRFVEEPKKALLGGFDLKRKTLEDAKVYITELTSMTHWSNDVTSIAFTFDKNGNAYRNGALLAMVAHRLLRPLSGRQMSLLDLFPEAYTILPKSLICRICSLIVSIFRTYLSDHAYIFTHALDGEYNNQAELFGEARSGTDERAVNLERWLTTRHGPNGWQESLEQALKQYNRLRGPQKK